MTTERQNFTFSEEAVHLKRSVMRDMLKHAVDPEIISLAGGLPANEYLPTDAYQDCLNTVLNRDRGRALQYGPQSRELCEWIANYMNQRGVKCTADNIFITNGNQQGLNVISRLFLSTRQPAVIEEATFTGIQQVTAGRGAAIRTIPTDYATGADMDALEAAFAQQPRPQLAILISDFHNPLGVTISREKRQRAAQLAAQYGVPLIEDDPYSALRFSGEAIPPIKAFDEEGYVFYLGSLSKMFAPAIRMGWLIAPVELMPKLMVMRESFDLESSVLLQRALAEFLNRGLLEAHLAQLNAVNKERCTVLMESLDEFFGDIGTWTVPEGGLFSWMTLHDETIDTWDMLKDAIDQKVAYIPGSPFAVNGDKRNAMRLNFSNVKPELLPEGVRRLADVVKKHLS